MKITKKYIAPGVLFVIFLISVCSCSTDEHVSPHGDVSSFTWWSSPNEVESFNNPIKTTRKDDFLAFQDLSRGLISHKWEISEGAAFLEPGFSENDTLDYYKYIRPNAGKSITDALAFVLFTEVGEQEVRLINTFKDSVAESFQEDGVWKVEKIISVTVTE
ncbi:hypothetical protein [Algibacter mikhailovii]|uniref:hypothetical protein n=1 Tax=Algibacter mikhailovii TaxID=425498 RepID=UPI002494EDBC|nr:hypothetical protein [Algibacter mikhailovii]